MDPELFFASGLGREMETGMAGGDERYRETDDRRGIGTDEKAGAGTERQVTGKRWINQKAIRCLAVSSRFLGFDLLRGNTVGKMLTAIPQYG